MMSSIKSVFLMASGGASSSVSKTDLPATTSTAVAGATAAGVDASSYDDAQQAVPSFAAPSFSSYSYSSRPAPKLMYPPADDEEEEIQSSEVSCDSLRRKINMYLATKEMTQAQFRLECGNINSNSFQRFMKLKGPFSGCDNGTYWGALKFFARRDKTKAAEKKAQATEQREAKKTAKRAAKEAGIPSASNQDPSAADTATPAAKKARTTAVPSSPTSAAPAASEYLPPEAITAPPLWDAPVFDDCDEVRRKLAQCIQSPGMSQAKIAKYIGVSPAAISKFLSRHGKDVGAGTDVYPRAYRYFERLRVMRNEPKSSHRLKNESKLPNGFSLENPATHMWVLMPRG